MNLQNTKIELIQWLTSLDDKFLLQKIIELRNKQTIDWGLEISNLEEKSIEKGLSDAENGKLNTHQEARRIYEKWL